MFIEKSSQKGSTIGQIEVICGSMFSGKTEELIRRIRRAELAKQKVMLFKPLIDQRYSRENIVSHDANKWHSVAISHSLDILHQVEEPVVVGIDEAQFFDEDIIEVCKRLANIGCRVIIAGLDMDYLGRPFGPMPALMAIADYVNKLQAVCMQCGSLAHFTHRISKEETLLLTGEKDKYEPLCRNCYNSVNKKNI